MASKKMRKWELVEADELERMRQRQLVEYQPEVRVLAFLQDEARQLLNPKLAGALSAEQRLSLYKAAQQRFLSMRKQLPAQLQPSTQPREATSTTERDIQTEAQAVEEDEVPEDLRIFLEQQGLPAEARRSDAGDEADEDQEFHESQSSPLREGETEGAGAGAGARASPSPSPRARHDQPESSTPFTKQLYVPAQVPDGQRKAAAQLLSIIQAHPDKIARGRNGHLYLNKRVVPNSHFNSLIVSLYKEPDPKHPQNLIGRPQFTKALDALIQHINTVKSVSTRTQTHGPQKGEGVVGHAQKRPAPPGHCPKILRIYR